MDNAKFHHIVMGRSKPELQEMLLKLGPAAFEIAADNAMLDEEGKLLPAGEQSDPEVQTIFKIVGI